MAEEGANIVLTDIMPEDKLQEVADKLAESTGAHVMAYRADVCKVEEVKACIAASVEKFGRIDALFNNAGYQGAFKPVHEYPDDDFPRVMNINVTGVFYFLKYATLQMKSQNPQGGAILNTAS